MLHISGFAADGGELRNERIDAIQSAGIKRCDELLVNRVGGAA